MYKILNSHVLEVLYYICTYEVNLSSVLVRLFFRQTNFCCSLCMCRSLVPGHCACAGSADRPGGAAGEGADLGPGRPVHQAQGEQGPRGDPAHRRR
jgi:hypothetical protein